MENFPQAQFQINSLSKALRLVPCQVKLIV